MPDKKLKQYESKYLFQGVCCEVKNLFVVLEKIYNKGKATEEQKEALLYVSDHLKIVRKDLLVEVSKLQRQAVMADLKANYDKNPNKGRPHTFKHSGVTTSLTLEVMVAYDQLLYIMVKAKANRHCNDDEYLEYTREWYFKVVSVYEKCFEKCESVLKESDLVKYKERCVET